MARWVWDDALAVSIRSENETEHGDHRTRWLAVLGVVLAVVVTGLAWSVPRVDGPGGRPSDVAAASSAGTSLSAEPFVVEPAVRIRAKSSIGPVTEISAEDTAEPSPDGAAESGFAGTAESIPDQVAAPLGTSAAAGAPSVLEVPSLGVYAPVIGIGAANGILQPPDDPQTLGWWSAGAAPGAAQGGALITGHTVSTGGGAFDNLETLTTGDSVRVRTQRGVIDYAVTGVTIYPKASLAADAGRVFNQSGPGRLVLITCEDWNGTGYDSNAIVFAERTA